MKKLPLITICLLAASNLFAQKIELSVQANSGLFHYSGKSAASESVIIGGQNGGNNYTNNPYGNKNGLSYGGDLQAQYISKGGFITGLQAGYDVLRSKVDINSIAPNDFAFEYYIPSANATFQQINASGQTYLKDEFINVSPYIGYRINASKIKIDLMPGLDMGFNISSRDKGKATSTDGNNKTLETDYKRTNAPTDVRLKFGAAAIYKKIGLTVSYAHGLTNYERNFIGGSFETHAELIRFGLSYRLL